MAEYDCEIKREEKECFKTAKFRLWYDKDSAPRAIITVTPGSGGDGRVEIGRWKKFASSQKCAVLGVYLTDVDAKIDEDYIDAKHGSGRALLAALCEFDTHLGIPLKNLPLLMWGFSAGGEFNYEFACYRPDRVGAFVVNKGGIYYTALAPAATRQVPSMWFIGGRDMIYRKAGIHGIYTMNRAVGATDWALDLDPGADHEIGDSVDLSAKFFRKVLDGNFKKELGLVIP